LLKRTYCGSTVTPSATPSRSTWSGRSWLFITLRVVTIQVAEVVACTGSVGGCPGGHTAGRPVRVAFPRPDPLGHCSPEGGGREGGVERIRSVRVTESRIASERQCCGKSHRPRASKALPRTIGRRAGGAESLGFPPFYPLKAATSSVVASCPRGPGGSRKQPGNHRVPLLIDRLASCRTSGCVRRTQRSPPIREVGLVTRKVRERAQWLRAGLGLLPCILSQVISRNCDSGEPQCLHSPVDICDVGRE